MFWICTSVSSLMPSPLAPKSSTLNSSEPSSGCSGRGVGGGGGCTCGDGGGCCTCGGCGRTGEPDFGGGVFSCGFDLWERLLWWLFGFLLDKESDKAEEEEELLWWCRQCLPFLAMQVCKLTDHTRTAIRSIIVMLLSLWLSFIIMSIFVCFVWYVFLFVWHRKRRRRWDFGLCVFFFLLKTLVYEFMCLWIEWKEIGFWGLYKEAVQEYRRTHGNLTWMECNQEKHYFPYKLK